MQALRAKLPSPFLKGRGQGNLGAPVRNPVQGPVFRQATAPVHARFPLPARGRTTSTPAAVIPPPASGPAFRPVPLAVRIRPALPPRGRTASNPGAPVVNPAAGPTFRQVPRPVRAPVPQVFSKGRTAGNPGIPVSVPAVFRQATSPARIRVVPPPRGRIGSSSGALVRNPSPGPVFRQAPRPVRAPVPQVFSKGRIGSNPGVIQPSPEAATLAVGLTLTAGGGVPGWIFTGPVPLTYLQYLQPPDGTLSVVPGEDVTYMGPASGYPYYLPTPPPDGRWVTSPGGGGFIFEAKRPQEEEKPKPPPATRIPVRRDAIREWFNALREAEDKRRRP